MKTRPSVQAVIYDGGAKKFLLIKKFDADLKKFCWRLVKGGIENNESETEAVEREVLEEVGLEDIEVGKKVHSYEFLWKDMKVTVSCYVVKADMKDDLKLQGKTEFESAIVDSAWLPRDEALERLYWEDEKRAISFSFDAS